MIDIIHNTAHQYRVLRILHPSAHCITLQLIAGGRAAVYVLTPKSDLIFLLLCWCVLYIVIADNIYVGFRVLYYIGYCASVCSCVLYRFVTFVSSHLYCIVYCVFLWFVLCCVLWLRVLTLKSDPVFVLDIWSQGWVCIRACDLPPQDCYAWRSAWIYRAFIVISLNISSLYCNQLEYIEDILWSAWISSKYDLEATHGAQVRQGAKKVVELHTAVASFKVVPWRNIPERKNLTISRFPWQSESSLQDLQDQHSISS